MAPVRSPATPRPEGSQIVTVVGVAREARTGEQRVALTADAVTRVRALGLQVVVESGAGAGAWCADSAYREAGADVVTGTDLSAQADVLVCVGPPDPARLRRGLMVLGMLDAEAIAACGAVGATAISFLRLPRTLSRAQAMDALTSQAGIAGYKAAVLAADSYGRYLPMMMTAAGTVRPANVLVLGAGVAGLAAIGTVRRLGAVVTGYDIRPEAAGEIRSLGAKVLDITTGIAGSGAGGYARALSEREKAAQQEQLQERIADYDIVIATAAVPGHVPPVLVSGEAVKSMRPGSVIIDLAASPQGGNIEGSQPDATTVVADGVTLIGAGNLPSVMAPAASGAYARNVAAVLAHLTRDGQIVIDPDDDITAAIVVAPPTGGIIA
jgi:NAD(P) transhydrogenase subunit alpha